MNPELVLVVGDMFVPQRSPDINEQFKSILIPNKLQHVLSLGNIGSRESYDWLKSLSNDFHTVKGDFDEGEIPEKKVVQIGEFKIGMIHGHQVLPWGDLDALTNIQLGCDILLSGHTHQIDIKVKDKKFYINPGSISGAFSHLIADPNPSFVLMVLQGEEAIVYLYILNDKSQKFELSKIEFSKGANEYKMVKDEEENEEEEEEEEKDDKKEKSDKKEEEQKEELKEKEDEEENKEESK